MKSPLAAFLLSFVLPGAGLWYLGQWRAGLVNLLSVAAIGILSWMFMSERAFETYFRYVAVGCSCASAGYAKRRAEEMNQT